MGLKRGRNVISVPPQKANREDRQLRANGKASQRASRSNSRSRSRSRSRSPIQQSVLSTVLTDNTPRSDRELFVGNTPTASVVTDVTLKEFLNDAMRTVGLVCKTATPIIQCRISNKSKFSFIEFDTADNCTKGLYLNGIPFMGTMLKIGRPSKYSGPDTDSALSWQQISGTDAPSNIDSITAYYNQSTKAYREIFAGNIPEALTETDLTEFIGNAMIRLGFTGNYLSHCDEIDDIPNPVLLTRVNGKYSFIEMKTAEDACNLLNLNGIPFHGSQLKLNRPTKFDGYIEPQHPRSGSGVKVEFFDWTETLEMWNAGDMRLLTAGAPSNVVMLVNMTTNAELQASSTVYFELLRDARIECSTYGSVLSVIVPRSTAATSGSLATTTPTMSSSGKWSSAEMGKGAATIGISSSSSSSSSTMPSITSPVVRGIGRVFVEMETVDQAKQVILALKGRTYNSRFVDIKFYPVEYFRAMTYQYCPPHLVVTSSHGPTTIDKVFNEKTINKLHQAKR